MKTQHWRVVVALGLLSATWAGSAWGAAETVPGSDVLMRALADELQRAMTLQMEDLERPYFVQFDARDSLNYQISAEYGAITSSERDRSRRFNSHVRVGSFELDNTNFAGEGGLILRLGGGGGGGQAALPLDDDYRALRQAIWWAVDSDYKDAVETLTKKRTYLKDKTIADRPNDFSPAPPVEHTAPPAVVDFDRATWEKNLQTLSSAFGKYEQVQSSGCRLLVGGGNRYIVNSDGTRLRLGNARAMLTITATVQATDGMRLPGSRMYAGNSTADFPPLEQIQKDIEALVAELTAIMAAPILDRYSGPVLFEDRPAAQMCQALLVDGLAGRPDPVGERQRGPWEKESLENKLGTAILPKTFDVWDDPTVEQSDKQALFGSYAYDDEGVAARRVDLVAGGKLKDMCLSRAPIKKLSGSNGHGRRASGGDGDIQANVGCLFIKDNAGLPADGLKKALLTAAEEAGLEYGIRIRSLQSAGADSDAEQIRGFFIRLIRGGGGSTVADPVLAYKVFVSDGHEEPLRGCQFGRFDIKELKRIVAAGDTPRAHNIIGFGLGGAQAPCSIITPALLFGELELVKDEREQDKPPLLKAPAFR